MYKHTEEDISLLSDPNKTGLELTEHFGCGIITITRWRKKYGIKIARGCKKGKSKPWLKTGVDLSCKMCYNRIYVTPSSGKKYCSRECMHSDPAYKQMLKDIDRSYTQTAEFALKQSKPDTASYKKYVGKVHRLSDKVYKQNIDIINPHGHTRTLAGVEGGWQLDHIIEVRFGFDNNIPAEVLAEVNNLRMLPWKENLERNRKERSMKI
tara:strand:+ start:762 stop:1388 length:627 start_codon:yes stop_codon:yes gene_type:complete